MGGRRRALGLVGRAGANADAAAQETVGGCAYGDGHARRAFAGAERVLAAKAPGRRGQARLPKGGSRIDPGAMSCARPAGRECREAAPICPGQRYGAPGARPLRPSRLRAKPGKGRPVMPHPEEAPLREAGAFQKSEALAPHRELRQVAGHRLARLMQPGVRRARHAGRAKTRLRPLMAATVANPTPVATGVGLMRGRDHPETGLSALIADLLTIRIAARRPPATLALRLRTPDQRRSRASRPRF